MELKDRLIALRHHLGFSQKSMAAEVGIDEKTWQRAELGKGEPRTETIRQLVRMGFNANWILDGVGAMRLSDEGTIAHEAAPVARPCDAAAADLERDGYVLIPRYDVAAAAGAGVHVEDEAILQPLAFKREWLHRALGASPGDLIVMTARGDSMQSRIKDGDILLVDRSEPKLRSGSQIYTFRFDGLVYVKRLQPRLDGGLVVVSDNPTYPPETISSERLADLEIIGRVLWSAGRI